MRKTIYQRLLDELAEIAAVHRAGYVPSRKNNFMRLDQWLQRQNEAVSVEFSAQYAHACEEFLESIKRLVALPERSARVREAGGPHA